MLEARNITISYGSRVAVSHVSLTLAPSEVTTIIGPNGAGKIAARSFLIHGGQSHGESPW